MQGDIGQCCHGCVGETVGRDVEGKFPQGVKSPRRQRRDAPQSQAPGPGIAAAPPLPDQVATKQQPASRYDDKPHQARFGQQLHPVVMGIGQAGLAEGHGHEAIGKIVKGAEPGPHQTEIF